MCIRDSSNAAANDGESIWTTTDADAHADRHSDAHEHRHADAHADWHAAWVVHSVRLDLWRTAADGCAANAPAELELERIRLQGGRRLFEIITKTRGSAGGTARDTASGGGCHASAAKDWVPESILNSE